MKKLALSTFIATACMSTAYAGVPVIDRANLAQQTMQVTHMVTQIGHMVEQVQNQATQIMQLKAQIEALTSKEGLKNLAEEVAINTIPTEWKNLYGDVSELAALANSKDLTKAFSAKNYDPNAATKNLVNYAKTLNDAFEGVNKRLTALQALQNKLKTANNVKEAADIQNRIATIHGSIQADQVMLDNMHRTYELQERIQYEQSRVRDYCINMKVSISRIGGELPEGCEEVLEELKSRGKP